MRFFPIIILFVVIGGCKTESGKMIDKYVSQVNEYEKLVDDGIDKNRESINKLNFGIAETIDMLNNMELSESQHKRITEATIQLQVSMMMVQEDMNKNMKNDLDELDKIGDSI